MNDIKFQGVNRDPIGHMTTIQGFFSWLSSARLHQKIIIWIKKWQQAMKMFA